jgi:hypothetical protein
MADMLSDGLDWLTDQLHANASRLVTYKRGTQSISLTSIIGRRRFQRQESGGIVNVYSDRDFIVKAAELILNGVVTEPADGDKIVDSLDGATYMLMQFPPEPCFQRVDNGRQFRCHTKRVKAGA